ncbi:MAG: hypothetical protein MJ146_01555 [Clostridia bacterium]|nr:hypothetical protein [Clostridia bacterium]
MAVPRFTRQAKNIYENNKETFKTVDYNEKEVLKVYRKALNERTFKLDELYALLDNAEIAKKKYNIDTSRPFLEPQKAKTEDYHMIHYQVRFNGAAARGYGVHPSPAGIQTKAKAILKAYETKWSTTNKIPTSVKNTVTKAIKNASNTISQIVGTVINQGLQLLKNLWTRK